MAQSKEERLAQQNAWRERNRARVNALARLREAKKRALARQTRDPSSPAHQAYLNKQRLYQKAYRAQHKDRLNANKRRRYWDDPERYRDYAKRKWKKYHAQVLAKQRERRRQSPEKVLRGNRKSVDLATPSYIAKLLKAPTHSIPLDMVEAKRAILLVKRVLNVTGLQSRRA